MTLRARRSITALSLLAVLAGACGRDAPPPESPAGARADGGDAGFAALERDYVVYFLSRFPVVATYLGGAALDASLADIDGRLRDHSSTALAHEDARWSDYRDRFRALDPATLSVRRQNDRRVALAQLEFLLHQHQVRRHQERALDSYVDEPFRGVDWQIQALTPTGDGRFGSDAEWRQVAMRVRAIPAYLDTARVQLSAGVSAGNPPDWRVIAQYGLRSADADARYFAETLPALAQKNLQAGDSSLASELRSAGQDAGAAYQQLREFIIATFFDDATKAGAAALKPAFRADRHALGLPEYDWALHNNLGLTLSAAQLFDEAQPIVDATRQELVELAQQIARQRRWQAVDGPAAVRLAFEKLGEDAPATDAEMLEAYRATGERLVAYARRTGLFEVPVDYRLDVVITPPPLRSSIDGAAYYPAPPFRQTGVGRFYVTPTGDDPVMLRQEHNRAALADLAAHEGFPGHDWHFKLMSQHRDAISAVRWLTPGAVEDSSSMWQDSMAAEGWALYSEALLAEPQAGAPGGFYTPEERLYQLRGKLYRDLRVRVDTGIHIGRLSFDDAVTLFSEAVDFLPGACSDPERITLAAKRASCESARGAITRYARWPTQAITYRLGKDQILALRARAQAKLGGGFSAQRFHVEFMKQGTIPASYFGDDLLQSLGP
jgi:uncharacterized protein (DUF885 family)